MSEKQGGDGGSFEDRLRAARTKRGLEPLAGGKGNEPDRLSASAWGVGLRVGVELVSALMLGVGIGWVLDLWLGTRPVFLAIFVLLGGAAGMLNVWRLYAPRRDG